MYFNYLKSTLGFYWIKKCIRSIHFYENCFFYKNIFIVCLKVYDIHILYKIEILKLDINSWGYSFSMETPNLFGIILMIYISSGIDDNWKLVSYL
jgi:hypothetical protein